jgi:hypothetical protein
VLLIQCSTRHHWILGSGMISFVMMPCCPCTVVWKFGHKNQLYTFTYFGCCTWWNSHHAIDEIAIMLDEKATMPDEKATLAWHTGVGSIEVLRPTLNVHYALPFWITHRMNLT